MGINLGSTAISDLKKGSTQVDKIYLGSDVVWQKSAPVATKALKFTSPNAQTLSIDSSVISDLTPTFEYSTNGTSWTSWNISNSLNFGNGVDLYIRGMNSYLCLASSNRVHFVFGTSSPVYCSGNIMWLFDYTQDLTAFPTTSGITSYGVMKMFQNCIVLVTPPDLPATSLDLYSYWAMFEGCIALTTPPALPALSIPVGAYYSMFAGCTSLIALPALPATSLQSNGYAYMFDGCSQIKMGRNQSDTYPYSFTMPLTNTEIQSYTPFMFRGTTGETTNPSPQMYTSNTIIS